MKRKRMNEWKKLTADEAIRLYLVPPDVAHSPHNHFYGRETNVPLPVDLSGGFLAFLVQPDQRAMHFHFTTNASEFHEDEEDYNPLTTPYLGQGLFTNLTTAEEMVAIIEEQGSQLQGNDAKRSIFQKLKDDELPFVDRVSEDSRGYYLQMYNPFREQKPVQTYFRLSGQNYLHMKVLQISEQSNSRKVDYNLIFTQSINVLALDKSGTASLCQIIRDFVAGIQQI
jgi:hypothetical protein